MVFVKGWCVSFVESAAASCVREVGKVQSESKRWSMLNDNIVKNELAGENSQSDLRRRCLHV